MSPMVDSALLEQVLRLDAESRRELISAVEDSLEPEVDPAILAEIDRRLAILGAGPASDGSPLEDFLLRRRIRRSA